jgi:hypothetical protein
LPTKNVIELPDWSWADVEREGVVWVEGGRLMRANLGKEGLESKLLIRDFNDMTFEAIKAPY